jgi:TP901 family phage tail tape measure protein
MSTFKLPVEQVGLERSIQKAMDQFNRKPLKINVDDRSFTQPLGRITGAADEFTKSIEASNARVVAFGASVAVIESVKNAFSQLVVQTIKVEKALADINVVMGTSAKNLDQFGNSLFKIAKNTAQSFDSVASAATEFARQGLTMEQTLKRTNDALILTRLTGMKAADSVKGLTAAINAFGDAGLSTANIMNKLAAVDMAFAVSSEDLIDGLSRASAVAQDAGMNIDQLIGAITAAQQITARGGAVIGNSFKTIFTRIQRPQTIEQLEMLGVAVKDMQGNVIPAIKILENLAKTYDTLSQSQQSNIAQLVGGMFQINTLKAAMRDLGKENSITARAIQISASATDEAVKKNEQLNKTLDALLTKTGLSLQQLADQIGSITVGPGIEKILKAVNGLADGISNVLDGDSIGSNFANGFLKGIGNVISGPGAVLILGLVGKLFVDVAKFASTSIRNFMGMTSEAQKQKAVQESILNLLRSNHEVVGSLIGQGQTKRQQEQVILDLIVKQTAAQREQVKLAQHLA